MWCLLGGIYFLNWHSIKHFNGEWTNQILLDSLRIPAGDEKRPSEVDTREFHAIWKFFRNFGKGGKILILPSFSMGFEFWSSTASSPNVSEPNFQFWRNEEKMSAGKSCWMHTRQRHHPKEQQRSMYRHLLITELFTT